MCDDPVQPGIAGKTAGRVGRDQVIVPEADPVAGQQRLVRDRDARPRRTLRRAGRLFEVAQCEPRHRHERNGIAPTNDLRIPGGTTITRQLGQSIGPLPCDRRHHDILNEGCHRFPPGCQTLPCRAAMSTGRARRRDSSFHMRRMTRFRASDTTECRHTGVRRVTSSAAQTAWILGPVEALASRGGRCSALELVGGVVDISTDVDRSTLSPTARSSLNGRSTTEPVGSRALPGRGSGTR